jgi:hypothetical protein
MSCVNSLMRCCVRVARCAAWRDCRCPGHRRGHGAPCEAVIHGRVDIARLRRSLAGLPLPRAAHGRLVLAADGSNWRWRQRQLAS